MTVKQTLVELIFLSHVKKILFWHPHVPPTQHIFYLFLTTKSIKMYTTSLGEMVQQLVVTQYVEEKEERNAEKIS